MLSRMGHVIRNWWNKMLIPWYFIFHSCLVRLPIVYVCGHPLKHFVLGKHIMIHRYASFKFYDVSGSEQLLKIGDNVQIGFFVSFDVAGRISIGENTMIASKVTFLTENHGIDLTKGIYDRQPLRAGNVTIGKNCWIGENVIVLPGASVGDNSIVGAGAVVTKDIPSNSIAVGNPARVIKSFNFQTGVWEKNIKG